MLSGCDTTTPCAHGEMAKSKKREAETVRALRAEAENQLEKCRTTCGARVGGWAAHRAAATCEVALCRGRAAAGKRTAHWALPAFGFVPRRVWGRGGAGARRGRGVERGVRTRGSSGPGVASAAVPRCLRRGCCANRGPVVVVFGGAPSTEPGPGRVGGESGVRTRGVSRPGSASEAVLRCPWRGCCAGRCSVVALRGRLRRSRGRGRRERESNPRPSGARVRRRRLCQAPVPNRCATPCRRFFFPVGVGWPVPP